MEEDRPDDSELPPGRRDLLKAMAAAGGYLASRVLLPALWTTPIVASMELPAHAAGSDGGTSQSTCTQGGDSLDPPAASTRTVGSGANGAAITVQAASGVLTLNITPPLALITAKTEYGLYEQFSDTNGATCVRIVQQMVPSGSTTLSGAVTVKLTRASGSHYQYQLRWNGGYTDWVPGNVP